MCLRQLYAAGKAMSTRIEWCDEVWNPVTGCTKVSEGCRHCYAETMAGRRMPAGGFADRVFGEVRCHPDRLTQPLRRRKPRTVFVCSMGDLFHEAVPFDFIDQVMDVIGANIEHTFLVLTKRPLRMAEYFKERPELGRCWSLDRGALPAALDNLWLGVSVEDQATANERIPLLLATPAAHRFVSYEPALGPLDLVQATGNTSFDPGGDFPPDCVLDQVIVGGESGPGARPFDVAWARSVIRQCWRGMVPCFVKQLGRLPYSEIKESGWWPLEKDGKRTGSAPCDGGRGKHADPNEWPADLRVRELAWGSDGGRMRRTVGPDRTEEDS